MLQPPSVRQASGQIVLENAPDNFSRGKTDVFNCDLPDLGALNRVIIGHDEKGNCRRWHLESLVVTNKSLNPPQTVLFPCGKIHMPPV